MTPRAFLLYSALAGVLVAVGACRPRVVPVTPRADLIVLVADPEDGRVGSITVSSPQGSVNVTTAQHATRVVAGAAPSAPAPMAPEEIERRFADAIAARPPVPREFLLYFETGSDTLTAESQALVKEIVEFVAHRPAPDVSVIGHTDTTSDPQSNFELGMRRATLIRDLLVKTGLDPAQVDFASHGEADLLVQTPDGTAEPKNRRVEVTVR